jgi:hypothetical protein
MGMFLRVIVRAQGLLSPHDVVVMMMMMMMMIFYSLM